MSKINAIRIINLNYNNNANKVSDECFDLHGENTLLSLQNGGGKTVLVQMMMAPFLHKRYQNIKDRLFASYFTTNKPTFIMVEWKLDGGAGYVLTGMMVRKNHEIAETNQDELEVTNFIAEYKNRCSQDIYHLPVVEKTKKERVLKSYVACKQLFESYKKEREIPFFYYDMNNYAQMRQYFDKLMEYQINYREWENIIRKINQKESGLSDLFSDCKDEKGLIEKWFLDAVESKLNKEKNRMQEFQRIVEKYIIQYRDNQSKIKRRDAILLFQTEAQRIQSETALYLDLFEKKSLQETRIADFIAKLNEFLEEENKKETLTGQEIERLVEEMAELAYEKISSEIYEIKKEISFHAGSYQMVQMEIEGLESELQKITETLHIYRCAKQQRQVDQDKREFEIESQKLEICREKAEDLEPERELLGSRLKYYYQTQGELKQKEIATKEEALAVKQQELEEGKQRKRELEQSQKRIAGEIGGVQAQIKSFDAEEEGFNSRYQTAYARNILGAYEPGFLDVRKQEQEKAYEECSRRRTGGKKEMEHKKEQQRILWRSLQDLENKKSRKEAALEHTAAKKDAYDAQLKERQVILHYFGLKEEKLFETEVILEQAAKKRRETDTARRLLENQENGLQKEYRRLTQGQVLELSDEFKKMLEDAGIVPVYGMEWLLKNKKSTKDNEKLVQEHPFLPYALIMSQKELKLLSGCGDHVYTSFPVPILLREALEDGGEAQKHGVQEFPKVSFYLWFNENLLDESKLASLVLEKEQEIKKVQKNIEQKNSEYNEYFEKQEKIRNQSVTKEAYDAIVQECKELQAAVEESKKELQAKRQEQEETEQALINLEQQVQQMEQQLQKMTQLQEDFDRLRSAYEQYQKNRELLDKKQKEQERAVNQQKLCEDKLEKCESSLKSLQYELEEGKAAYVECQKKQNKYEGYEAREQDALQQEEAFSAETRFIAITGQMTEERQELEKRLERASGRYRESRTELAELEKKYHLVSEQWLAVSYDAKEAAHQEKEQNERKSRLEGRRRALSEAEIKIEKCKTREELKYEELRRQCNKTDILPSEAIKTNDFEGKIEEKKYQKHQKENEYHSLQKKIRGYEEILTALAEYTDFSCKEAVAWDVKLETMNTEELTKQKGLLLRDYNDYVNRIHEKRGDLERLLGKISRMEAFSDSFYQKPIEALSNLTGHANQFQKQLDTILQSFENLMKKLLVDISFVEKEKEKVVELMEDYLKEVHENLGKIDYNSTIKIREKPVKMLKIDLPQWEENAPMYHLRLCDFIDEVTGTGIAVMEQNGNIGEVLGTRITTNSLYDAVVGIGSIQIRMYKIEAQREYPITWSDVAKNSGGEGFLSAFVILSSLLYYMRKDDTDIFSDNREGKVLIMDNPFAQTNASHLLIPLMEMAKKTNTQLICLSGLGGESIYSRFDNIYVLTLVAANLHNGMQYLKADHMRGSEEEVMLVSQVEVVEQQELIF